MYAIFEKLLQEKGITPYKVAKATGIATATLSDWKNGKSTPKADKMQKIADYFGVTLDYLLGNEQKETPTAKSDEVTFDDFTYALHNQSKELNDANKEKLLDMARMLKLAQDAQKNK